MKKVIVNKMEEIWKDIKGYEGLYQVSNLGRVKRILFINRICIKEKEKMLKPRQNKFGYLLVSLSKNGKIKQITIHRLVAETFLNNPNNYSDINHKDENKQNNNVDNLEFCTHKYNTNYGTRVQKIKEKNKLKGKSILQIKNGKIIKKWFNIKQAGTQLNINTKNICSCCKGKRKSAGGYQWQYAK